MRCKLQQQFFPTRSHPPTAMPLTIPELIEKLSKVDQTAQLAMYVDHRLVPIHEVLHMPSTPHVFLCEKPQSHAPPEYTESENDLIRYCAANGVKDEVIASLLGRTPDAIVRQRKRLGF
jgi:hypothetical protein